MKYVLIIIILVGFKTSAQPYEAVFKTIGLEPGVVNYEVQQGQDTLNWISIATILPLKKKDSNNYIYVLPPPVTDFYVRIKANMVSGTYITKAIFVPVSDKPQVLVISNATYTKKIFVDALSFDVKNDSLASYYAVQRSVDLGKTFTHVAKLYSRGLLNYKFTFFRRWTAKPIYKVTPVLRSASQGLTVIFK